MRARLYVLSIVIVMVFCNSALAGRNILSEAYRDRLEGMWLGQMLGNYAGRQVEGRENVIYEGPNAVSKHITEYQVQWNTILAGQWYGRKDSENPNALLGDTSKWLGDDDTCLEFLYAHSLQSKTSLSVAERTSLWTDNISVNGLFIANRQAWHQINDHSRSADQSGTVRHNMNAGWAIDSQITTESLGAIAVGMRRQAANLAGDFGGITNSGYSLHAAQFYAAMYAESPLMPVPNVETLVNKGLEVVPTGSWTREIVVKAQQLYQADLDDGDKLDDWRNSRDAIISFAHQRGRDRIWVESSSNLGLTTLAILYGQGDFKDTVEYGVCGGEDSDCNPATAGGLIGMMKGNGVILAELALAGLDVTAIPQMYNDSLTVVGPPEGLPKSDWTTDEVLDIMQAAAETQILAGGGTIIGEGATKQYTIVDAGTGLDLVITGDVSDPDSGPGGLVGYVLGLGGQVDVVVTRNGVPITDNSANDRTDQSRLIDGVVDLTNNGVLPFDTYDSSTDARTDSYEIRFNRNLLFNKLVLYEGDIRPSGGGGGLSYDPSLPNRKPYGGYFTDLIVEVFRNGGWVEVEGLSLSEALDPYAYFQSIELSFDPITGEAIRVVGTAGGQRPYTSLTEIVVVPEPATVSLLVFGGFALLRRRRNRQRS